MNQKKGSPFLIELLIVVSIIGILAAIAIPSYIGSQEKARKSNLLKAVKSAEADVQHWMNSALKGVNVTTVGAPWTEVDTNWNGTVQITTDLNNFNLFNGGPANASVAGCYVGARTQATGVGADARCGTDAPFIEMSPWAGMNNCAAAQTLYEAQIAAAPAAPNTPSAAPCRVVLYADPASTSAVIIIGSSNGPGGVETANAEELDRKIITSE